MAPSRTRGNTLSVSVRSHPVCHLEQPFDVAALELVNAEDMTTGKLHVPPFANLSPPSYPSVLWRCAALVGFPIEGGDRPQTR